MDSLTVSVFLTLLGICGSFAEHPVVANPIKSDKIDHSSQLSGELLADHVAEVEYTGKMHRKCMFRTALCPDRCDHAQDFATFRVIKYLNYQKPGKYGDEKQEQVMIDMNPAHKPILQGADIVEKINALKPGDKLVLHWSHYYMHQGGNSFPERPVISIKPLAR